MDDSSELTDRLEGFVPFYRQSVESNVFRDPHLWHLFSFLLFFARFKRGVATIRSGRGESQLTLKPGQLVVSRTKTAEFLNCSPDTFRGRLERLKRMSMITLENVKFGGTLVTITNWEKYNQGKPHQPKTQSESSKIVDATSSAISSDTSQENTPAQTDTGDQPNSSTSQTISKDVVDLKSDTTPAQTDAGDQANTSQTPAEEHLTNENTGEKLSKNGENGENVSSQSQATALDEQPPPPLSKDLSFDANFSLLSDELRDLRELTQEMFEVLSAKNSGNVTKADWQSICQAAYVGLSLNTKDTVKGWITRARDKTTLVVGYFVSTAIQECCNNAQEYDKKKLHAPNLDRPTIEPPKPKTIRIDRERLRTQIFNSDRDRWRNASNQEIELEIDRRLRLHGATA